MEFRSSFRRNHAASTLGIHIARLRTMASVVLFVAVLAGWAIVFFFVHIAEPEDTDPSLAVNARL